MSNEEININRLHQHLKGRKFFELIEYHLHKQSEGDLFKAFWGTVAMLPKNVQPLVEQFIDRWNNEVYSKEFWQQDTSVVFEQIIKDAILMLMGYNCKQYINDKTLFNLFQIIVLNYAYSAASQPKMRSFMGIKTWKDRISQRVRSGINRSLMFFIFYTCFVLWVGLGTKIYDSFFFPWINNVVFIICYIVITLIIITGSWLTYVYLRDVEEISFLQPKSDDSPYPQREVSAIMDIKVRDNETINNNDTKGKQTLNMPFGAKRFVITLAGIALVITCTYLPWHMSFKSVQSFLGYAWIWAVPKIGQWQYAEVDIKILIIEFVGILALSVVSFVVADWIEKRKIEVK